MTGIYARAGCAAAIAATLTMLFATESRADQFVLFDATFTYTWDDAVNAKPSKSHYYVNEGNWLNKQRPGNWLTPVNYRDGKVHIRAEVLEKPAGTQQAGWGLCYVANVGSYGCPYTDYYTKTGVYERDVDMHNFFNNDTIQWDRGVKQVDLVYTINGSGSGHITNFPELKDLVTPTKVRITMVQVSSGSTYDPGILSGGADAGTVDGAGVSTDSQTPEAAVVMTEPDATAANGGAGGSSAGTNLPSSSAGSGGGPRGAGGAPSTTTGDTPTDPGTESETGGCSMKGGPHPRGPVTAALLAMAALAAQRRRRRHRRMAY